MRTSMPGLASWNAATRVTSHLAASEAVVLTVSTPSRSGRRSRAVARRRSSNALRTDRQIGLRLAGQLQGAIAAHEQRNAELLLQAADQMADRGLGDIQLLRGAGEAEVACRCLEGAQAIQRRQGSVMLPSYMISAHVKTDKVSFVRPRRRPIFRPTPITGGLHGRD